MSSLLLAFACAPECPGGAVRGVAGTVGRASGGTVHLYEAHTRTEWDSQFVSGYRRFEFVAVPAGRWMVQTESHGGSCDCWSDLYAVTVCDGPVEVYPGEDEPTEDVGFCECSD